MIIRVLYYYFYLFYKKILKEDDPHLTTVLALSFLFFLYAFGFIDMLLSITFHIRISMFINICLLIIIAIIMHIIFLFNKKGEYIVKKEKPMIYNNTISKIITITIFILSLLIMFFEQMIIRVIT